MAGLTTGAAWLSLTIRDLHRTGNMCFLATYASMGLWMLTPWGIYAQARQLAGEFLARLRVRAHKVPGVPTIRLVPPFRGCWLVVRGGVSKADSHSWGLLSQRYAYDLVVVGDAEKLERPCKYRSLGDWETYGAPVAVAAPGVVVRVVDGIDDNEPVGWIRLRSRLAEGNHVVVKHATGVYSLYAHLRKGSIKVRPGDRVEAGQIIAEAGNSGMSTAPHLHFQLMTTPDPLSTISLPAPMRYRDKSGGAVEGYPAKSGVVCWEGP